MNKYLIIFFMAKEREPTIFLNLDEVPICRDDDFTLGNLIKIFTTIKFVLAEKSGEKIASGITVEELIKKFDSLIILFAAANLSSKIRKKIDEVLRNGGDDDKKENLIQLAKADTNLESEWAGKDLAIKAYFYLFLQKKVRADIVKNILKLNLLDKADYLAVKELFQEFVVANKTGDNYDKIDGKINKLIKKGLESLFLIPPPPLYD